jgi:hypothetical protein
MTRQDGGIPLDTPPHVEDPDLSGRWGALLLIVLFFSTSLFYYFYNISSGKHYNRYPPVAQEIA